MIPNAVFHLGDVGGLARPVAGVHQHMVEGLVAAACATEGHVRLWSWDTRLDACRRRRMVRQRMSTRQHNVNLDWRFKSTSKPGSPSIFMVCIQRSVALQCSSQP